MRCHDRPVPTAVSLNSLAHPLPARPVNGHKTLLERKLISLLIPILAFFEPTTAALFLHSQ